MKYKFNLSYRPTVATVLPIRTTRVCFPLYNDDLAVSIDRADDEWYYTRSLEGNLVFIGGDYSWIMALPFDGTFTINIQQSTDGTTYHDYFTGTFSRASMEIDEDNCRATLSGLKEGITDLVKNGAKEEYDLMKLIPDSYAKEVQGQVPPALALVDYRSTSIDKSDVFCGGAGITGGYDDTGFNNYVEVTSNSSWKFIGIKGECRVKMHDENSEANGSYAGHLYYSSAEPESPTHIKISAEGTMRATNGYRVELYFTELQQPSGYTISYRLKIYNPSNTLVAQGAYTEWDSLNYPVFTPVSFVCQGSQVSPTLEKIEVQFHYIRATLLTQSTNGVQENVLDTGDYYQGMSAFEGSGLSVSITARTVEQPNGHRMIAGSADYGGTPQYFAPPDDSGDWIALAEDNWNFASMWYKITPSIPNGLLDPDKFGSFRWTRCWTIGCCIMHLLKRITDDKVVFAETTDYSQFLYGNPNPVQGHEPFQWLVTQKSNVMSPAAGGASRCPVRLDWFFELLRNALNCYYWFEKRNDGRYDFRIEHVEYFRRGGAYSGQLADQLDLTRLKPVRNFLRNGQPAKRYADQTNRYTFDLDNMVEKYTYSWQGDGGGDDFKGNPMYFNAGWIEKGSVEDHQVDNIFADLGWLMLNAGTDTASSKNFDGLFIFGGYRVNTFIQWKENEPPQQSTMTLADGTMLYVEIDIFLTIPEGQTVSLKLHDYYSEATTTIETYTGTGSVQSLVIQYEYAYISPHSLYLDFGEHYSDITINRIHARSGNVFRVPNVQNRLRPENYIQNGVLAWPWLQCEYLHYDIPAAKWTYLKDDYTDDPNLVWEEDGTIKMVKKQSLAVVPVPDAYTENAIMAIMGVRTGLGTGIIDSANVNLSSRNAEMTIIYDINPQSNQ